MTILQKPIITEKSIKDATAGIFTFAVRVDATKPEIKKEAEKLFSVHVKNVVTVIRKGKEKRAGKQRRTIVRPNVKIARLKLAKGEKIDFFEIGKAV
jgi:large subunit ribosomal protein L23